MNNRAVSTLCKKMQACYENVFSRKRQSSNIYWLTSKYFPCFVCVSFFNILQHCQSRVWTFPRGPIHPVKWSHHITLPKPQWDEKIPSSSSPRLIWTGGSQLNKILPVNVVKRTKHLLAIWGNARSTKCHLWHLTNLSLKIAEDRLH